MTSMRPKPRLAIFAKEPRLGTVKRRLARDIGAPAALRFYQYCLKTVVPPLIRDRRWQSVLCITPDHAAKKAPLWPQGCARIPQGPGGLGERMGRVFETFPPGPVVIVGTDIPALSPHHVAQAFAALGSNDAVFGPAKDGGYWLIGLSRVRPPGPLFDGVRWSGPHALADTLANLKGHKVKLLEELEDVDNEAAYDRWRKKPATLPGLNESDLF